MEHLASGSGSRTARQDVADGRVELTVDLDYWGARRFVGSGLEYQEVGRDTYAIVEEDPLSAAVRCEWRIRLCRDPWRTCVETVSTMSADADSFHVTNAVDAYEGNVRVAAHTWTFAVPRDLV
jgi:hypothetical protein